MRIEVCVYRLTLLILSLAVVCAQGAELYVSTQGSDSNPGTSAQPFRTISHAYSLAAPGTTINVLPGMYSDYTSGWGLHLAKSGTASSPIVLRSQVKGGAIIDGQNALDRNKGIYLDGSYHIIDGFVITRAPGTGIFIEGSYNQILNNEIHHNGSLAEGQLHPATRTSATMFTTTESRAATSITASICAASTRPSSITCWSAMPPAACRSPATSR